MLEVRWTPYGRPATDVLCARVDAAKADDPLAPVTIVVPGNVVGVSVRRRLAARGCAAVPGATGIAGVTFLTVFRLAELLGAARLASRGRRPVSTPVLGAAVRAALADDAGAFEPVAGHPSTEHALVAAHRELADLDEDALDRLAGAGPRAGDVVRIHRDVRARLAADWYDEATLMAAARAAVAERSPVARDLGAVLVHLPQRLGRPAAELLRALADLLPVEVIAGRTGAEDADRDVLRTLARLGVPEDAAAMHTRPGVPGDAHAQPTPTGVLDAPTTPAVTATRVVCVSDAEEEVRAAVGEILDALRDGVQLERIALLYPHPEPYARLVHEHLAVAGIPYNGRAVRPLAERLLGRWLLDALALEDRDFRRQDVLDLLCSAPVRRRDGRPLPTAAWERASRDAGVLRTRADWDERLAAYAERTDAEAARARAAVERGDDDARPWLPGTLERHAGDARALRGFVLELIDRLRQGRRADTWPALADWARALVTTYLGDEEHRRTWTDPEEVRAATKVEEALDRLALLDGLEPRATLATFRRALESELDDDLGRVGRLGHGVLAGTLPLALGVDLDVVVVLGCAEGVLPDRVREDSLLPDSDRGVVADHLPPRAERVPALRRALLAALAGGQRRRVMCYPRGDLRRSVERPPSRWLLDAVADLPRTGSGSDGSGSDGSGSDGSAHTLPAEAPWLVHHASFASAVRRAAPATRRDRDLRVLAAHRDRGGRLDDHALVRDDPALRRGLAVVRAHASPAFTRFDGNVAAVSDLLGHPRDAVTSATRLETYARCPSRYLLEHVLGVAVVENPEELLEISPLDRGTLVHEVLETWLREQLDAGVPAPSEPWPEPARHRLREIAEETCLSYEDAGLVGHPLLWRRDRARILGDLERFLDEDDRRRQAERLTPLAAELAFGTGPRPPVTLTLDDGTTVRVRGKVDRLDRSTDGRLAVIDYKTGGAYDTKGLSADDPLLGGEKLQLPIYALAARAAVEAQDAPVTAEYWFVTSRHGFERRGYEVDEGVLDHARAAIGVVVEGIAAGRFPARPAEPGWRLFVDCHYCDPDRLGTSDRWRRWRRKRHAQELRAYVELVEPDTLLEQAGAPAAAGGRQDGALA